GNASRAERKMKLMLEPVSLVIVEIDLDTRPILAREGTCDANLSLHAPPPATPAGPRAVRRGGPGAAGPVHRFRTGHRGRGTGRLRTAPALPATARRPPAPASARSARDRGRILGRGKTAPAALKRTGMVTGITQ